MVHRTTGHRAPDGGLWLTDNGNNKIGRAPACGLGFTAGFANSTLTTNLHLGIDTPATFTVSAHNAAGPVGQPFSQPISAVVPPQAFTMNRSNFPDKGRVTLASVLSTTAGFPACAEWTTVNTEQ